MKKGIFILLGIFMMVSTVEANDGKKSINKIGFNYSHEYSVNFEERGIEFFIFTNGEFDFNTQVNYSYYNSNHTNEIIHIDRDYRGRISRIGNAFLHYDIYGNISRIGNVSMRYYRGKLTDVGNLKVRYNSWGSPTFYGNVKNNYYNYNGLRINLNIGEICNYSNAYFYRNDFRINYSRIREDNNYYYYRANPNANIGSKSKTLRRRKPTSTTLNNKPTITKRRTSYRRPYSTYISRNLITDKRSNNTSYRKSNSTKRNIEKTIKQKTLPKARTLRNSRS